jgi:hypothetical protein
VCLCIVKLSELFLTLFCKFSESFYVRSLIMNSKPVAGHYALTTLLLDKMKETAAQSGIEGRIMFTGSEAHRVTYKGGINFDAVMDPSL